MTLTEALLTLILIHLNLILLVLTVKKENHGKRNLY